MWWMLFTRSVFFFKQKTAYEMRISDWSSDVCSSDLRLVISTVGDGSYMFGTPLAAHFVAAEQKLPVLFVVFNNRGWHAVRRSTRGMYRDGYAAKAAVEPLTDFGPDMQYEKMMDVVGGYGERVDDPEDLPKALDRSLAVVRTERRQALLNVTCLPG